MLSSAEAILLGLIQGITEFFPISSSGHLTLFQSLLGLQNLDKLIIFDLVCHLGTLLSIACIYRKHIAHLFTKNKTGLLPIFVGTLPLFPAAFFLKPIENLYNETSLLGFFFLGTAAILSIGILWGSEKAVSELQKKTLRDAFLIGCSQAIALLPGISRSGTTISAARLLGWKGEDALSFSFMLAIPAILGGTCLKIFHLAASSSNMLTSPLPLFPYAMGFLSSFLTGTFTLWLLIKLDAKQKLLYFVWYCFFLGIFLVFLVRHS